MTDRIDRFPAEYSAFLQDLKARIRGTQLHAALALNSELVLLYWRIGKEILAQQRRHGWGAKIIDQLARDLKVSFPDMRGLSPRNLKYMRAFAEAWPDEQFVQQVAAQIPWFHNCVLIDKTTTVVEREWYIRKTIEHGWSRSVLVHQIESRLRDRQGTAITNFSRTLPKPQSDLARDILKDPYTFDFLSLGDDFGERDLERGLIEHVRSFLLELGVGFAFVGSQYHLEVGGQDFFIDLLFYHLRLRCYVVVELKVCEFQPEFAGKMSFYLSAADDILRHPDDKPSIGIILCKTRERVIVEYALRNNGMPIGVAEYQLADMLPEQMRDSLPTVEALEEELQAASSAQRDGSDNQFDR